MRFIGDIHGKVAPYLKLLEGCEESIQIGDFGMGFLNSTNTAAVNAAHADGKHRFIRGNHDDPDICADANGWIEDGHYDADRGMMLMGGAWSIDHAYRKDFDRKRGTTSWWPDEELTTSELIKVHANFVYHKPRIMVTHDAPMQVSKELFFQPGHRMLGEHRSTPTAEALQAMFNAHQPEIWIFGHWHISKTEVMNGTKFICLAELEYLDI